MRKILEEVTMIWIRNTSVGNVLYSLIMTLMLITLVAMPTYYLLNWSPTTEYYEKQLSLELRSNQRLEISKTSGTPVYLMAQSTEYFELKDEYGDIEYYPTPMEILSKRWPYHTFYLLKTTIPEGQWQISTSPSNWVYFSIESEGYFQCVHSNRSQHQLHQSGVVIATCIAILIFAIILYTTTQYSSMTRRLQQQTKRNDNQQ